MPMNPREDPHSDAAEAFALRHDLRPGDAVNGNLDSLRVACGW
jgi:hypothetical protein